MSVEKKKRSTATDRSITESEKINEEPMETGSQTPSVTEAIEPVNIEMASLSVEELAVLQQELEEAQKQSKEYFEGWQRERADFINYKKRIERDQYLLNQAIKANIFKNFLDVLDDMELAVKNRPENAADQNWWEGVGLICRKLIGILESEGVTRIPAEGELFDPTLHEAISHDEDPDHQREHVIEVIKQGYMIGDRVIRPALVRVAR